MRKLLIALVSLLLVLTLVACASALRKNLPGEKVGKDMVQEERGSEMPRPVIDFQPGLGDVVVYWLRGKDEFSAFLNEPSIEILIERSYLIGVFRRSRFEDNCVDFERIFPYRAVENSIRSGGTWIGQWPVYVEFIDFMNDNENFVQVLLEQGIEEDIINVAVIMHPTDAIISDPPLPGTGPTICIWIQTSNGNYFLEHYIDWEGDLHSTNFLSHSRFHDLNSFKIRWADI